MNPRPDRKHREDLPRRRIGCKWYRLCLDHALHAGWSGFHCSDCNDYIPDHLDPEESHAEIEQCLILLWAIRHPEQWQHMGLGEAVTRDFVNENQPKAPGA